MRAGLPVAQGQPGECRDSQPRSVLAIAALRDLSTYAHSRRSGLSRERHLAAHRVPHCRAAPRLARG